MKRFTKINQKGVSSLETVLLVVIVAIIGFVGWLVYHSNQQANNTLNTANLANSSSSVKTTSSTKTSQAAGERAKLISTGLLSFSKSNASTPLKDYVNKHVNDGQFTPNFKNAVGNGSALVASGSNNPVYCSATSAPSSFKVASSNLNGDTAMVSLNEVVAGSTTAGPQLTLNYVSGTWSVDQYVCT